MVFKDTMDITLKTTSLPRHFCIQLHSGLGFLPANRGFLQSWQDASSAMFRNVTFQQLIVLSRHRWTRRVLASQGSRCQCGLVLDEIFCWDRNEKEVLRTNDTSPWQTLHNTNKYCLFKHVYTGFMMIVLWIWPDDVTEFSRSGCGLGTLGFSQETLSSLGFYGI